VHHPLQNVFVQTSCESNRQTANLASSGRMPPIVAVRSRRFAGALQETVPIWQPGTHPR